MPLLLKRASFKKFSKKTEVLWMASIASYGKRLRSYKKTWIDETRVEKRIYLRFQEGVYDFTAK